MGAEQNTEMLLGNKQLRAILFVLILTNLVLLVVSQIMMSFEVDFKQPQNVLSESTFRYNLWRGAYKLYKSNLKLLAVLLLFWSGIWPHIKLLGLAFCCLSKINYHRRERVLHVLSLLGKWSFLDLCVVIGVVLTLSFESMLGWAQATALNGCYAFASAIFMSQILGHLVPLVQDDDHDITHSSPVAPSNKKKHKFFAHGGHLVTVAVVIAVSIALVIVGQVLPCLHVVYTYTVFSIPMKIAEHEFSVLEGWHMIWSNPRLDTANHMLAGFGLAFVSLAPILHAVVMFAGWFVIVLAPSRISRVRAERWKGWIEVCGHWSMLDVYLLSLVLLVYELGNIGATLTHNLNITVDALPGIWIILAGVLAQLFCGLYLNTVFDARVNRWKRYGRGRSRKSQRTHRKGKKLDKDETINDDSNHGNGNSNNSDDDSSVGSDDHVVLEIGAVLQEENMSLVVD